MSQAVRTDPRLSARKAEVKRAEGRRRLRRLLAAFAAGLLAGGVLALLHSPLLSARSFSVTGAVHETTAEVLAVSGLSKHPPLIDLDLARAAAAIERLPWVGSATVARRWPAGASVSVVERRPLAFAREAPGRFALIDGSGRVLAVVASPPAGLAPLGGLSPLPPPGGFLPSRDAPLLAVARAVPLRLLPRLTAVSAGASGVELSLSGGALVELGPPTELPQKMVSLMTMLDHPGIPAFLRINLTVASAPVLTP